MNKLQQLSQDLHSVNVLYVEDEDGVREETLLFLNRIFKNIDSAINGKEGLELFKKGNYDLVITDLKMPKMNGRDMLDAIHKLDKDITAIVMTASDSNIDASQTKCDVYLFKPVMFTEFVQKLETLKSKLL